MLDPLVFTIDVPCSQETAFRVFAAEMGDWWPLDKRSMSLMQAGGKPARSLHVEAKQNGRIVETGHDGTQYLWGTINIYDPHEFLAMGFHMGLPPENASLVEVRFSALDGRRTRVELTHGDWEAFGDMAQMMRGGYGSSWGMIFEEAYKSACGG